MILNFKLVFTVLLLRSLLICSHTAAVVVVVVAGIINSYTGFSARAHLLSMNCAYRKRRGQPMLHFPRGEILVRGREGASVVATKATRSQERRSFDLIIWGGQSAFVDEESL